jgi:hypothetical protein
MSRAIKLTRIHTINWYGYNDSLPVAGNVLLAGVTGSGKSVLMDLIMTVLVGTDVARNHFNRSATGAHSDRTLKSYCLLDTKREENGVALYQRENGAITYVALEFTWPAKLDGQPRVETWGLRIEFRNAAEIQGRIKPFFCEGALGHEDFLATSPQDQKRRPHELAAFQHIICEQKKGRMFETQDQFLRDMANGQHLNFNRAVLASLLPQAMAFTNSKSFDNFIRDFVLPGDQLNVTDVVASYRSFLEYERDLHDLHDQLKRLQTICDLYRSYEAAKRDHMVARWLAADLAHRHAAEIVRKLEADLSLEKIEFSKEADRIAVLEKMLADRKSELEQLKNIIRSSPNGDVYLFLKEQNRNLDIAIEGLRAVGTRVDDALRNRAKKARQWLNDALATRQIQSADTTAFSDAVKELEGCEVAASECALKTVIDEAEQVKAILSRAIRPSREKLDELRKALGAIREEISALELGHLPFPTLLLQSLLNGLPHKGREAAAQPLCKLCELLDEKWRAAVEVAFEHKFSVIVSEVDFERAQEIYYEMPGDSPLESLIDPAKALYLNQPVRSGSLAEKIKADHPVARAVVSHLFGDLMCVENREDLGMYDFAVLPDGFLKRGPFLERVRFYDGLPFVGRRGLELQLALKQSQRKNIEIEERRLSPVVSAVQGVLDSASRLIPEHTSLTHDLHEARRLPILEKERDGNLAKLNAINSASFEEKELQINELEKDLPGWEHERLELLRSQKLGEIQRIEMTLENAKKDESAAFSNFDRVQREAGDISIHVSRLNEWRAEIAETFPTLDSAAQEFARLSGSADKEAAINWAQLVAARTQLALVHHKFDDLAPDNLTNAPWDKLWHQVAEANIPEYEQKAKTERARWEHLFRNNVLQKLDQALRRLRDDVFLLNGNLKTPIGNDIYEIVVKPNPDFKTLRELVQLNALHQRDELFYAAVDGRMRDTLDHFLKTLVEKPDSLDAVHLLDYRRYHDYDLVLRDIRDPMAKPISVDKQSGKMSGGENQSPYFVVILASYLRAYNRHEARSKDPSLGLVPIDEAFSKMDTGRIRDCIEAIKNLDLQGVFSMSTGNVPGAFSLCEQLVIVSRNDDKRDGRHRVRNIPVSILRHSDEGRDWMQEHS